MGRAIRLAALPTTDPTGSNALFLLDINGLTPAGIMHLHSAPYRQVAISAAVPESSTWLLMLIGFAGLGYTAYRQTTKQAAAIALA